MEPLVGHISQSGQYPDSNEILTISISDQQTGEPGLVYANPSNDPTQLAQIAGLTVQQNIEFHKKQLVIYNDPRAALQAIKDLGLRGALR